MVMIYKIENREIWHTARSKGYYNGSKADQDDGFIHFSTSEQLTGTLSKHFAGRTDLLLIAFNAEILGPDLKWEPARNGDLFPHLYGPLPTTHILWEKPIEETPTGSHILPQTNASTKDNQV